MPRNRIERSLRLGWLLLALGAPACTGGPISDFPASGSVDEDRGEDEMQADAGMTGSEPDGEDDGESPSDPGDAFDAGVATDAGADLDAASDAATDASADGAVSDASVDGGVDGATGTTP